MRLLKLAKLEDNGMQLNMHIIAFCFTKVLEGLLYPPKDFPGSHIQARLLSDAPRHNLAKASGNGAKKSSILNKPGFLSTIVRETLIQFTLFPSDKKKSK